MKVTVGNWSAVLFAFVVCICLQNWCILLMCSVLIAGTQMPLICINQYGLISFPNQNVHPHALQVYWWLYDILTFSSFCTGTAYDCGVIKNKNKTQDNADISCAVMMFSYKNIKRQQLLHLVFFDHAADILKLRFSFPLCTLNLINERYSSCIILLHFI